VAWWCLERPRFISKVGALVKPIVQKAPLSQRDDATRYVNSKFMLCSRGMGIFNSKSEVQRHSVALAMVPFDFLLVFHCNHMSLSCIISEILGLSLISKHLQRSRNSKHVRFGQYIIHALVLLCINQHTKFEVHSFNSKYMMRGKI